MSDLPDLTDAELAIYEWQSWVRDFGVQGQQKLKAATVFVSRVGGVGGAVAYQLAAAGVGRLVLAHAGNIKPSDLNRQLLMTHAAIGTARIESICKRLNELNPHIEITGVGENVSDDNVARLIGDADVIVDCAPLFSERFAMNRYAVAKRIPLVECAMYELEAHLTTFVPGRSACLNCLHPTAPPTWKRQFPVFGAVSGTVGCMAALEAIKLLSGLGTPLIGRMLRMDLRAMTFHLLNVRRDSECSVCASVQLDESSDATLKG